MLNFLGEKESEEFFFLFFQENVPIEEVFESLRCSREGLTTEAADERLALFGHNKLEEKKVPFRSLMLYSCVFWNFGLQLQNITISMP